MNMTDYQRIANDLAPDFSAFKVAPLPWTAMALGGETGEVLEEIKRIYRDDKNILTPKRRLAIEEELGDVLWCVAIIARYCHIDLDTIALSNIHKLVSRKGGTENGRKVS